jgi:hypothetical protein
MKRNIMINILVNWKNGVTLIVYHEVVDKQRIFFTSDFIIFMSYD